MAPYSLFPAFSSWPVHFRKCSRFHFSRQTKRTIAFGVISSAFMPEYVSIRHFRYSLRHGRRRLPRVAFQTNRMAAINRI